MDTRTVIERYYECVNRGAGPRGSRCSATMSWATSNWLATSLASTCFLRGAIDAISTGYSRFKMYPQRMVVEGDAACVVWRCDAANAKGTRIAYSDNRERQVIGANFFQLQNGKIVYMRTIHDSLPFQPFINQSS